MRPDEISLVAKSDKLICMFGAQYLRQHRGEHFVTVVSRKMRELAKLLLKIKPNINSLEQVLQPQYYGILVHATKIVARYNDVTGKFDVPTYTMNIATSIKQCCGIALMQARKMETNIHTASLQTDLRTLSKLITENWKFDISNQAADDLSMKWNKTTIVLLAADLKLLMDYLCKVSKLSSDNLKENVTNVEAFDNLVECTYCRVLLLNRRRHDDIQRITLNDYIDNANEKNKFLSCTEKMLIDNLKRIVIRGKRGEGVPVLFTSEIQNDINILLSMRHLYVSNENNFLFVKTSGSIVCDYKILEKYAQACGATNYRSLTSTRLRKHLATMSQLFSMTETQREQLATFMGHALNVYKDNYQLPSDIYQTAKISKLLVLMEDGKADQYKGKAFDEIDFNLNEEVKGDGVENEKVEFELEKEDQTENPSTPHRSVSQQLAPISWEKKKRKLVPWTNEQKNVVTKYFKQHIQDKKPPRRAECDEIKKKYPTLFQNKDWLKIKVFIQNIYMKK
ncbi:uncharacterized protein LOC126779973 [Nymphalis io]|uniref:uncharacterized protein LOC126779973 n=1 Tax=Inachis io TaxID=171585 RepID=UPI00216757D5|nr:uncharacterized protein LOC126779973 [Nymphalis io]